MFADGVYIHDVVPQLESDLNCDIQFVDPEPRSETNWQIRVDGVPITETKRRRDPRANTVFNIESTSFEEIVDEYLESN